MSTKNVTLKEKVNGAAGNVLFPATTTPNVYDSAKSQALSQTLVNTPDYEALGFAKFSTATAYNTGDKVYKDNGLYRFIADKTAGEWDVAKVEPWSIEQEIEDVDDAIRSLIPAQASADNKLADKEYVNDKVSTDTATFRGTFNLVTDLELTTEATQGQIATALGTAISGEDKNDYAFVLIPTSDATPTEIARIDRYKYTGLQWAFEYSLNNSGFTAEQWAAINSGITSSLVTAFGAKYDKPDGGIPASDMNTSTFDDEPTAGSDNLVKSGGVHKGIENYADKVAYLPTEYTEITASDMELQTGRSYYPSSTPYQAKFIEGASRSYYRILLGYRTNTIRKIKITAGVGNAGVTFFVRQSGSDYIRISDEAFHVILAGETQEIEVPINTFQIIINNYTIANVFPAYIGIAESLFNGRDLKGYIDTKTFNGTRFENVTLRNLDIVLTEDKIQPNTFLHYLYNMNGVESGLDHIAYFAFYDDSNQQISGSSFGKTAWTGESYEFEGYIQVPSNAKYLRFVTDIVEGCTASFESSADEIPDDVIKGEYSLEEINPFIFNQFNYIINTNNYVQTGNYKMTFIPVIPEEIYCIESVEGSNLIAFVTNRNVSSGMQIPFSSEFNSRISLIDTDGKRFYKIPSDCHYIATMTASADGTPKSAKISLVKTEIENSELPDYIIPTKQLNPIYTNNQHYLNQNSKWETYSTRGFVLYKIPENTNQVKIKGLSVIAFFTSNVIDYTQAPPLAEKSLRLQTPNDTTDIYIDIPKDAKYLYVYKPDNTTFYDISFVTKTPLPEIINNKIESNNIIQDFGTFEEIDYTQGSYIQNMFIGSGDNPDIWNSFSGRRVTMFQIPNESKYIRITPIITNATFFLLRTDTTPVRNQKADLSEGYKTRISAILGTSYILPLLNDCKYIAVMSLDGNGNDITPKIEFASKATKVEDKIVENSCEYIVGNEIWDVEFNDAPDILFANYGEHKATGLKWMTWPNVLKVSDNMYYMYYNSLYDNDTQVSDQDFHLSLAYSTDGLNWVHEIPSGITAPIPGTNKLFENGCFGQDVVKVPDSEYPYRMVGFNWHTSTAVYKSADGVNWIKLREYPYYYDTQASVIVRGKYMKVYLRMRNGAGRLDRYIGILTMDLDGNELTPPTIFFGKYFYQASASELDWRREILFPTFFNQPANTQKPECFIVDENKIYPRNVDFSNIVFPVDLSIYFAPHIINIGSDFYIYYTVANQTHDNPSVTPRETTIKRAKITFKTVGYHWYPQ